MNYKYSEYSDYAKKQKDILQEKMDVAVGGMVAMAISPILILTTVIIACMIL